jgi:hypothetical protein
MRRNGSGGEEKAEERPVRLFHDDTFKGFFRRLAWSIDGIIFALFKLGFCSLFFLVSPGYPELFCGSGSIP